MIEAGTIVFRHLTAFQEKEALLEKWFGDDTDPLDKALEKVGKDMNRRWDRLAPKVLGMVSTAAKKFGVSKDYLEYVIFANRQTWPVRGKDALALSVAKDIVLEASRIPSMSNLPAAEDDEKIDDAVKAVASWAKTSFASDLRSGLLEDAAKHAKSLIKKLGIKDSRITPMVMAKYIMVKFKERLGKHTLMFDHSYLLKNVVTLIL